MNDSEIIIGNLTTILMFVFSTFGGGAIIAALGGTSQAAIVIGAILGLAYSFINAYFPNHLAWLNNNRKAIDDVADAVSNIPSKENIEDEDDGQLY